MRGVKAIDETEGSAMRGVTAIECVDEEPESDRPYRLVVWYGMDPALAIESYVAKPPGTADFYKAMGGGPDG